MDKTRKGSVLVVDDDNNNIVALTNILKTEYTVYAAKDGQSAIEAAENFLPDIILLDIIMSDMDGYAVITALKKIEKVRDTPVILITGLSSAEDEEKGLEFGVVDYITKPFSSAIVKLRVRNQMRLIEQFRSNEYDIMKYKLPNDALKIALWDLDIAEGNVRNPNSKFTWSQEFRDVLGFSDENDFPNTSEALIERFHPEDGKKVTAAFVRHLMDYTGKTPYDTEYRLRNKNDEYRHFHAFGTAQRDSNGVPLRMAGAIMDITEKKQVEEKTRKAKIAEESNKAKSRFLATMSHEIRTPMNSIMGFAELAMDQTAESQTQNYLRKISDSTRWLLRIINDILDISKVESGKMELEKVAFSLQDVISRCQSVILPSVKDKGLGMRFYVEPPTGKKLLGDPVRLYQVIINLLSNAVKFTNTGTVKFYSTVKKMEDDRATIFFEVRDSGIGMTPEQLEKIFAPFIQADSSTTRNYGGTGLGLTIAKSIVELMNGELTVESSPGVGSIFCFEVTFDTIDASAVSSSDASNNILERPCFDGLVLVCDDNHMNQQVAYEHLARVGLGVVVADNGKIGLDIVRERLQNGEKPFDLIFMDIFMPIMDGIEAASKITELNTGTPIVAMTANVMISELDSYRKSGMPDYLGKPFTSQELWRILLKYLTPVGSSSIGTEEQTRDTDELLKKLQINFVKNNQSTFTDIIEAIDSDDLKLAHRLAHTLKGNAAQIGEKELQNIAGEIEELFNIKTPIPKDKLELLNVELTRVLEKLQSLFDEHSAASGETKSLSKEQIAALFEEIEPMLENINPAIVNLLSDIHAIPGAEKLAHYIENYDFESAADELAELKKKEVQA
ncbi:MAG: response regulator [Fibromonadaceae bacterium]|jgi:signal transduction histidine kinase/DNA-binding response OmpR family regulator|nr:response regulator [Fibromonadaceae bacterium]